MFLTPTLVDGKPDYGNVVEPSFEGRLGTDALVVGFPKAPDEVLGEEPGSGEYFVVLEERMVAPRFGLDVDPRRRADDVGRAGVDRLRVGGRAHLDRADTRSSARSRSTTVVWGRNAAHLAAAVHQRPFRRLYPASDLVAMSPRSVPAGATQAARPGRRARPRPRDPGGPTQAARPGGGPDPKPRDPPPTAAATADRPVRSRRRDRPAPAAERPRGRSTSSTSGLPLALFPVRLEARFLPDADPDGDRRAGLPRRDPRRRARPRVHGRPS